MIELTDDQRRAVAEAGDAPPRVVDGKTTYLLVRAEVYERLTKSVQSGSFEVPEGIKRSRAAIRRDLPALLSKSGEFVCYRGDNRVGVGDYKTLMVECN